MRSIKLRGKQDSCAVCGTTPSVTAPIDYVKFCSSGKDKAYKNASDRQERVTCKAMSTDGYKHMIDVRPAVEFGICALENAVNVPFAKLMSGKSNVGEYIPEDTKEPVYLLCR